jgi:hypothetical protein
MALVTAKAGDLATQWDSVTIVPASFVLFGTGPNGPVVAQNIKSDGSAIVNGLAAPAQNGQPVVLWGTGLGATPQSAIAVSLGGVAQTVLYAGLAPSVPGVNQINFRVAAGTPDGCYVPLTLTYGKQSVTSFLSKTSDGSPCQHPFGLGVDAMKALDSGKGIPTAEIILSTATEAAAEDRASRQESGNVTSPILGASDVAAFFAPATGALPACSVVVAFNAFSGSLGGEIFDPAQTTSFSLKNGATTLPLPWTSPAPPDAPLANLPAPVLAGNRWTWTTSNPPAGSFDFTVPPALQISGSPPATFNRTHDQTISWNGAVFDPASTVQLALNAQYPGSPVLTCSAPGSSGSITIPSSLLTQFAAGAAGSLSLTLTPGGTAIPHAQMSAPGIGQLLTVVLWATSDSRPVDFQ